MEHLIVPVDGSPTSWRAAEVAVALARRVDARIDIVEVVPDPKEAAGAVIRLEDGIAGLNAVDIAVTPHVDVTSDSAAGALAERLEAAPESTMVMASHGRGRSAALLGSVTEELLAREFGPILVVGPDVELDEDPFAGPLFVTVDGSDLSETALPLAVAWAIELKLTPWVIEVNSPKQVSDEHRMESSYPSRLAREMRTASGHGVEFEVLHGHDAASTLVEHATASGASLIVLATHGRTGLARLTVGSTAAAIVRHARCPVLVVRPPHLDDR